ACSSSGSVINSGVTSATIGRMLFGMAQVTNPAPLRRAAKDAIRGAPDLPNEPPMINACPYKPLFESRRRRCCRISGGEFHSRPNCDWIAFLGEPISATTIGPRASVLNTMPGFKAVKVTIALLRHALG